MTGVVLSGLAAKAVLLRQTQHVLTGVLVGRWSASQVIVSKSVESGISGHSSTPVYSPCDLVGPANLGALVRE